MKCVMDQKGQAMLEFVLVFPVIMLLIMGIIEFSMLANAHQMVDYAAFNAARSAAVDGDKQFATALSCIAISPSSVNGMDPGKLVPDVMLKLIDKVSGMNKSSQKLVYSYVLTRLTPVEIIYFNDDDKKVSKSDDAAYLKAVVTYYYPLKFPVINTVADMAARADTPNLPWPMNDSVFFQTDKDYYTPARWVVAAGLKLTTGVRFVPIVKYCYMGIK